MPTLLSVAEPIAITKQHYEELIRDSERVNVLKRIMQEYGYIKLGEIKAVLEIKDESMPHNIQSSPIRDKCMDEQ